MKKNRNHPICEKHPLLGIILTVLVAYLIITSISSIASAAGANDTAGYLVTIVAALIVLTLLGFWFAPQFKGFLRPAVSVKTVLILCVPELILSLIATGATEFTNGYWFFKPSVNAVVMALTAGVFEETLFRAAPTFVGMGYLKSESRSLRLAVVVSILFGLSHLANLTGGSDLYMTILQAVSSAGVGLMFMAIYLRTGSILPTMFLHALYDWMCFVSDPTLTDNGLVMGATPLSAQIVEIILTVIRIAIALYMLRKSKWSEINEVWNKKW